MSNETKHILPRTGAAPLVFDGVLIARADDGLPPQKAPVDWRMWHALRLYQTKGGKYVIEIQFRIGQSDEPSATDAYVCETKEDILDVLVGEGSTYNPVQFAPRYPSHNERLIERERIRDERIVNDFELRVSKILIEAGIAETVD